MRLQVTHVKPLKNEEVIVPNSVILNKEVVNYSARARREGLILHTTVSLGYETPWRQVEALLLMAAERTPEWINPVTPEELRATAMVRPMTPRLPTLPARLGPPGDLPCQSPP